MTAPLLLRAVQAAGTQRGDVNALSAAGGLAARLIARLLLAEGYRPLGIARSAGAIAALSSPIPACSWSAPGKRIGVNSCAMAQGRPPPVALDTVGGEVACTLASMLADGGSLASYGLSSQALVLPALAFSTRGISIQGVSVGSWTGLPDAVRAADIKTVIGLARSVPEALGVAAEYELAEVAEAVRHAKRPGKWGTILLH